MSGAVQSVVLLNLINLLCQPIERDRSYMYAFHPDQINACYRAANVKLGGTELDNKMGSIEHYVTSEVEKWVKNTVPTYLTAPIVAGYSTMVEQKLVIPLGTVSLTVHFNGLLGLRWQKHF